MEVREGVYWIALLELLLDLLEPPFVDSAIGKYFIDYLFYFLFCIGTRKCKNFRDSRMQSTIVQ